MNRKFSIEDHCTMLKLLSDPIPPLKIRGNHKKPWFSATTSPARNSRQICVKLQEVAYLIVYEQEL